MAINFGLEINKTAFPHTFVNNATAQAQLHYMGGVPSMDLYPAGTFTNEESYLSYIQDNFPNYNYLKVGGS